MLILLRTIQRPQHLVHRISDARAAVKAAYMTTKNTTDADLSAHIAQGVLSVKVTPKASRNRISATADGVRVYVTAVPEGGKANGAVQKLLAKALGLAKSRVVLIRGDTSRDKLFRIDG